MLGDFGHVTGVEAPQFAILGGCDVDEAGGLQASRPERGALGCLVHGGEQRQGDYSGAPAARQRAASPDPAASGSPNAD